MGINLLEPITHIRLGIICLCNLERRQINQSCFILSYPFQSNSCLSNPSALSNMTDQSQIESCLEFDKKNSALKFVTLHVEVVVCHLCSTPISIWTQQHPLSWCPIVPCSNVPVSQCPSVPESQCPSVLVPWRIGTFKYLEIIIEKKPNVAEWGQTSPNGSKMAKQGQSLFLCRGPTYQRIMCISEGLNQGGSSCVYIFCVCESFWYAFVDGLF